MVLYTRPTVTFSSISRSYIHATTSCSTYPVRISPIPATAVRSSAVCIYSVRPATRQSVSVLRSYALYPNLRPRREPRTRELGEHRAKLGSLRLRFTRHATARAVLRAVHRPCLPLRSPRHRSMHRSSCHARVFRIIRNSTNYPIRRRRSSCTMPTVRRTYHAKSSLAAQHILIEIVPLSRAVADRVSSSVSRLEFICKYMGIGLMGMCKL